MLCEKCNTNPATIHYTRIVNGVADEFHLCAQCAAETEKKEYADLFDGDNGFAGLLSGIFGSMGKIGEKDEKPELKIQCPECKMTYGDFIKQSKFGCPVCYDVFGLLISDKIKKLHGSDIHTGKRPGKRNGAGKDTSAGAGSDSDGISVLRRRLEEAVMVEDFEEAARLRDEIAGMKDREESNG